MIQDKRIGGHLRKVRFRPLGSLPLASTSSTADIFLSSSSSSSSSHHHQCNKMETITTITTTTWGDKQQVQEANESMIGTVARPERVCEAYSTNDTVSSEFECNEANCMTAVDNPSVSSSAREGFSPKKTK